MKTVLITGGSRGIGRELVRAFSGRGYSVAFTYKASKEEALLLSEETGAYPIYADSLSEADVTRAVAVARERLGDIYCLINNAGVSSFGLFGDIKTDEWRRVLGTNLDAAFLYSREVSRDMVRMHTGRIINVSSMWGICGSSCEVAYSTSKAGINGMTKALAKELGPSGITVNAIAPGLIDTDMNSSLSAEDIQSIVDETPMMRIGNPSDVSALALFLAGEGASFITGEIISVNGGFVI